MLRKIVDFAKKIFWTEPMVSTVNTLKDAMRDLEVARNHFENCDPEFITAAIFELNAAESRLDAARRCAVWQQAFGKKSAICWVIFWRQRWLFAHG